MFGGELAAAVGVGFALDDVVVGAVGRTEAARRSAAVVDTFSIGTRLRGGAIVGGFPDTATTCIILAFLHGANVAACGFKGGAAMVGASRGFAGRCARFAVFVGFAAKCGGPHETALATTGAGLDGVSAVTALLSFGGAIACADIDAGQVARSGFFAGLGA